MYPRACWPVTSSPMAKALNRTNPAFLAVPSSLTMTEDVLLITRNDATFTAKPSNAAKQKMGKWSRMRWKSPLAITRGTSRKHASPHIHRAQMGAIRYKPSKAPNLKLHRSVA